LEVTREYLSKLTGFNVVAFYSEYSDLMKAGQALAMRDGAIMPLVCNNSLAQACRIERHDCPDTTAAGGNVSLVAMPS